MKLRSFLATIKLIIAALRGQILAYFHQLIARFCLAFLTTTLLLCSTFALATTTYKGSAGVFQKIFFPSCIGCHSGGNQFPDFDNIDFLDEDPLEETSTEGTMIDEIIRRIELPFADNDDSMPKGGNNLSAGLIAMMNDWKNDGTLETSPPELTTEPVGAFDKTTANMKGTIKENGRDTQALFKYWETILGEPENCPSNNSLTAGCTATTSPPGSGGDDSDPIPDIMVTAQGLNCATSYTYRAMSLQNGPHGPQSSATTQAFVTDAGIFDTDLDLICDAADNCPLDANPLQEDTNNNGIGDACDVNDNAGSLCFPIKSAAGPITIICL